MSPCNCISEINGKLEEHELDTSIVFHKNSLIAATYTPLIRKDNSRAETRSKKPQLMAHTFCPFCGTRVRPEEGGPDAA